MFYPNFRRAFLELGLLSSSEHATETVTVYHKDDLKGVTKWSGFIGASHQGFFACGLRAKFLRKSGVGSISGLDVRFCSKDGKLKLLLVINWIDIMLRQRSIRNQKPLTCYIFTTDWFDQEQKIVYR